MEADIKMFAVNGNKHTVSQIIRSNHRVRGLAQPVPKTAAFDGS